MSQGFPPSLHSEQSCDKATCSKVTQVTDSQNLKSQPKRCRKTGKIGLDEHLQSVLISTEPNPNQKTGQNRYLFHPNQNNLKWYLVVFLNSGWSQIKQFTEPLTITRTPPTVHHRRLKEEGPEDKSKQKCSLKGDFLAPGKGREIFSCCMDFAPHFFEENQISISKRKTQKCPFFTHKL